jgi:tRNA-splicing ligase RtcB
MSRKRSLSRSDRDGPLPLIPSPGTPGEGQGEGLSLEAGNAPSPQPPGVPGEGAKSPPCHDPILATGHPPLATSAEPLATTPSTLNTWLADPLEPAVSAAIERLRRADDVLHIAVMPDVHLAADVCVGTVMATDRLLYPGAVGGDIGCGMLAVAFHSAADLLADAASAGRLLAALPGAVPAARHHRSRIVAFPPELAEPLSHPSLDAVKQSAGALQLGTLGGGNHFVEFQADDDDRLWLMIHSGSRAMGQAIRAHHLARAFPAGGGLRALDAGTDAGRAYAADVAWARRYADANRRAMAEAIAGVLGKLFGVAMDESTLIACDHNHVAREEHSGRPLWVHRKGAMPAADGLPGVLPGSMGTASFHVEGRGCVDSLLSSAHGAGRAMSREQARKKFTGRDLCRRMQRAGVWFDYRMADTLRDESPEAYKDVHAVLRAQHELVCVKRVLRPVLTYKGR